MCRSHSLFFKRASFASLVLAATLIVGCGKGQPDAVADAPQIQFECQSSQSAGCKYENQGRTVFFGLTENTAIDCRTQLSFYSGDQLTAAFNYSGQTKAKGKAFALEGYIAHWVNSYSMPITLLEDKIYKMCAFIDLNNNGTLNSNEPYAEMSFSNGTRNVSVSDWTTF